MNTLAGIEEIVIWLLPPGLSIGLGALGLILWPWRKLSRLILAIAALILIISAVPGFGLWLEDTLGDKVPVVTLNAGTDAASYPVVVLTGGIYPDGQGGWWPGRETVERISAGLAYARANRVPLILAGGSPHPDVPLEAPVAVSRMQLGGDETELIVVPAGGTTHESAAPVAERLRSRGIQRVVVATHKSHSLRTSAVLRHQGIEIYGRIPVGSDSAPDHLMLWVPSRLGLSATGRAVYEFVALAWYLWRGYLNWPDLAPSKPNP